jgi:tetratricopeptide (TPR) repeat protein
MNKVELLILIWPFVWPILAVIALGMVFRNLADSGFLHEHKYVGWLVLALEITVFLSTAAKRASAGGLGFVALAYILFMGYILAMQARLVADLLILTFAPDRSDGLKVIKSYSMAERKIIQDDLGGSIAEYKRAIAEDPDDVEARLRLAEVLFENADYRMSVETYDEVLQRQRTLSVERRCLILTRLASIHAGKFGDKGKARELLQSIIDTYPGTRFSEYAKERMADL